MKKKNHHKNDIFPERVDFRIFDCPRKLVDWYISYAKLHHDNKMWKVLEEAQKLLEKKMTFPAEQLNFCLLYTSPSPRD